MLAFADSLPQQERPGPAMMPSCLDLFMASSGPGAVVMRLLSNRNLSPLGVSKSILHLTEGRRYWAHSSYNQVGMGRKKLTPDLLGDMAPLLDIAADDLAELTGVIPEGTPIPGLGEIVWAVRRLTRDQVEEVSEFAKSLG
ncbi:hypothetical protein [Lentzea sp. NPDC051838]|uniref:hypothetical protein n=1 Tax=Lentzea sp. NPDC051838 TaxID=3154849 RepID=UPI003447FD4F